MTGESTPTKQVVEQTRVNHDSSRAMDHSTDRSDSRAFCDPSLQGLRLAVATNNKVHDWPLHGACRTCECFVSRGINKDIFRGTRQKLLNRCLVWLLVACLLDILDTQQICILPYSAFLRAIAPRSSFFESSVRPWSPLLRSHIRSRLWQTLLGPHVPTVMYHKPMTNKPHHFFKHASADKIGSSKKAWHWARRAWT